MGTQVPEPDLNTIQVDSPPTMVAEDEGHDSFEDEMRCITESIRLANTKGPERGSPETSAPTSILEEIHPWH